jgi:polyhydroxyalkanoate synthase
MNDLIETDFDRRLHAAEAKIIGGLSPSAIGMAYLDWMIHLANQPGRRAALGRQAGDDMRAIGRQAMGQAVETLAPSPTDHRFTVVAQCHYRHSRRGAAA